MSFFSLLLSAFIVLGLMTLSDWTNYRKALLQYNDGNYAEALNGLEQLKDYKDSQYYYELSYKNKSVLYLEGLEELKNDPYKAWKIFSDLGDFSVNDSTPKSSDLAKQAEYAYAQQLFNDGKTEEALPYFQELDDYEESKLYVSKIISESEEEYQKSVKYANPDFKARRRIVEVTHAFFNRFRKLLVRFEKKADNYLALIHFACATIV